jgi:hypothetical protein
MPRRQSGTLAVLALAVLLSAPHAAAQNATPAAAPNPNSNPNKPTVVAGGPVNYEEDQVGSYSLPDPLRLQSGEQITDPESWFNKRRPELIRLFEENQFGRTPGRPPGMSFDVFDKGTPALDGKAIRKQVTVYFSPDRSGPKMDLLMYLPANARGPVPLLLNLSFFANAANVSDPGVRLTEVWGPGKKRVPATRSTTNRLNVEPFLAAGIGVATVYYADIDPDFLGGVPMGVRSLFLKPGQTEPAPDEWGSVSAWAWGMSRALDYLETDPAVDAKRVALTGASRLGKTVLWAGARDPRFAMIIASVSGEGGAALSRRNYGETVAHLTAPSRYPYQFAANYGRFANKAGDMPMDSHELISLIAPRPLLLQTGDQDFWSDPKGEFLAAVAAEPVYRLFGEEGPATTQMPAAGQPILHPLGYVMHSGGHGVFPADWPVFLKFMQMYLLPPQ